MLGSLLATSAAHATDLRLPPNSGELGSELQLTPWIQLRPYARFAALHNSNVRLVRNSRANADVVLFTSVGAEIAAEGFNKRLELSYGLTAQNYVRLDSLDTFEHRGRLRVEAEADPFAISLSAYLNRLTTPVDPRQTGEAKRLTSGGDVTANWKPNDLLGVRLLLRAEHINFQRKSLEFFDQLAVGVEAFATIAPVERLTILVGGGYRELIYTNSDATTPNYSLVSASVGVEFDLFSRLRGTVFGGYEYGSITRRRQSSAGTSKPSGPVLSGRLVFLPPISSLHETNLTLFVQHRAYFESAGDFQQQTRIQLGASQKLPADLSATLSAGYELQEPTGGTETDLQNVTALVGLDWTPFPLLTIRGQARYVRSFSSRTNVEVVEFGLGLTLTY